MLAPARSHERGARPQGQEEEPLRWVLLESAEKKVQRDWACVVYGF
jgi:hypothetical protein